jgi:hypothetical protein
VHGGPTNTRLACYIDAVGHLPFRRTADDVGLVLHEVAAGPGAAVPGVAGHAGRLGDGQAGARIERHAEVGHAVGAQAVIIDRELEGVRRLDGRGQKSAPALILDIIVSPGDVLVMQQHIAAHGQARTNHLIEVDRGAHGLVGAKHGRHVEEIIGFVRLLGDEVDGAARDAASGDGSTRALVDLDLLDGEGFARGIARVAHAIDKDVTARVEAPDIEGIAEGVAALGEA